MDAISFKEYFRQESCGLFSCVSNSCSIKITVIKKRNCSYCTSKQNKYVSDSGTVAVNTVPENMNYLLVILFG